MAETYKAGRGIVESIRIGESWGSAAERSACCVTIRHGPAPKAPKAGAAVAPGASPPHSTIYVTEAQAKKLSRGDAVRIVLESEGEEIPAFKNARERDAWQAKRNRRGDDE